MSTLQARLAPAALPLLLALLPVAVWAPSLGASFQFDDWAVIVDDARVQSLAAWWDSMPGIRPLLKLSYAMNHAAGAGVHGFRATNVLLHGLNTALLFLLLSRLARAGRLADEPGARIAAALATLVFALHPVQAESVTYVSGRSGVLATTFALSSLLLWLHRTTSRTGRAAHAVALLALLAGVGCRETVAVTPLLMLLCAQVVAPTALHANLRAIVPALLVSAIALGAGWAWTAYDHLLATSLATRSPLANLAAQVDGVSYLIGQLWRWDRLNVDPLLVPGPRDVAWFLRALALVSVPVASVVLWRGQRATAFAVLWFTLWLLPTNSVFARLDLVNDRHLYLALAGPAFAAGLAASGLRRAVPWFAALLALSLATGTVLRNQAFATEVSFWSDVVAKSPANARAANNLGIAHALACEPAAAAAAFERALEADRADYLPAINLELLRQGALPGVPARCGDGPPNREDGE